MRNRIVLVAAVLIALSGCGADKAPHPADNNDAAPSLNEAPAKPRATKAVDELRKAVDGVGKLAEVEVRYDRPRTLKNGSNERQVFVEMIGPTAEQTDAHVTKVMEQAGFTARRGMANEKGIRVQFRKSGVTPINVLVRSKEGGPALKNAKATSSLYLRQLID